MCSGVSLQVKSVVKTFPTEGTEVSLDVTVTLHMPVEESLQGESFAADPAPELAGVLVTPLWRQLLRLRSGSVQSQGILDPVTSIDELQGSVWCDPELQVGMLREMFGLG